MVAAVVSPAQPPAPLKGSGRAAWWRYVERGRAHEVLALLQEGRLVLRESAPGAPEARTEEALPIAQPWEARVALWQLECRLSLLGAYWRQRSDDAAWRRLATPPGAPTPDLRRNLVVEPVDAPFLHHYHDPHGGGDRLLAGLRAAEGPARYVVVRASIDVPALEVGRIDVLQQSAPETLAMSALMREQLALTQAGLAKLVTRSDYAREFGAAGERRAASLADEVVSRVRDREADAPGRAAETSEIYQQFLVTVNDPRLLVLHRRFLREGEEEALLQSGAPAIRRAVAAKRAQAEHGAQHLLSLLEASLLARTRMRTGRLVHTDPEVRALTRLAYYL